jgi:ACS family glucarate transporter-like MFS transporter
MNGEDRQDQAITPAVGPPTDVTDAAPPAPAPAPDLDADMPPLMRPTGWRYLVLAALCAVTTIAYIQRNAIGNMADQLRQSIGVGLAQFGVLGGCFFFTYALCQIPSGWLGQKWGPRRALAALTAAWSLAVAAGALADGFLPLAGARLALGALQAGIFPCATLALAFWFPPTQRGFASGVLSCFMQVGGLVAALATGLLLAPLGWRGVFALYALPGLAWALWFVWWFRDRPAQHPRVNAAELALIGPGAPPRPRGEGTPWLGLLRSPALWWINLQQFCRAGANIFFANFFVSYLKKVRFVGSDAEAGAWQSLTFWGAVVGTLVGGFLSDFILVRTGSRRAARQGLSIASLGLAVCSFVLAVFAPDLWLCVLLFSLGNLLATASAPCAYAITMDMGGKHLGVIFSTMNMSGNIGAALFPVAVGMLIEARRWDLALCLFVGLYLASAIFWLFLNPAGVIADREPQPR